MVKKSFFAALLLFVFSGSVQAQVLDARVDNPQVAAGEVFNLNISYTGSDGGSLQPDLSVLNNDFSVYSTSSSMQTSYINGQMSQRRDWDIGLMPKREGAVTIPAVSVGKMQTKPIQLQVLPAGSAVVSAASSATTGVQTDNQLAQAARFSTQMQVENKNPYVQQQVTAVLTIEDSVGLQFAAEPTFIDSANWVVKRLGQPVVTLKDNGTRDIKFYYALFPQKSGVLDVPSVQIDAFYVSFDDMQLPQKTRGFFQFFDMDIDGMFGVKKPVKLLSKPVEISVRPAPESYGNAWWLPANALALTARWSDRNPVFKVGETVAREITLTASGVTETQLPELAFADNPSFKQYPEQPQYTYTINGSDIISQAVVRVVYIPQKGGENVLPEIKLPWFNVKTGKTETAVIPAEKVFVTGEAVVEADSEKAAAAVSVKNDVQETSGAPHPSGESALAETKTDKLWPVAVGAAVLAFLCGVLLSFLFFRQAKKGTHDRPASAWQALIQKNLANHDYRALRDNLLHWGNEMFSECSINNLNDLSEVVQQEQFRRQMDVLNSILYADGKDVPQADVILDCLKACKKNKKAKKSEEPLPQLYK